MRSLEEARRNMRAHAGGPELHADARPEVAAARQAAQEELVLEERVDLAEGIVGVAQRCLRHERGVQRDVRGLCEGGGQE